MVEQYWSGWKKGGYTTPVPAQPAARRAVPPRAVADPDPAAGDGRLPRPGLFRYRQGRRGAVDAARTGLPRGSELGKLAGRGLSQDDFETTRDYLMKNVFVMTATQDQRLGYALDAQWHGTPEFTRMMREGLAKLTVADVNAAVRRHLSARDLSVVFITKDAAGLKNALVPDAFSPIAHDAAKPQAVLDEDRVTGAMKLGIKPENVRITPAAQAFAE
jgi:hypothetical protein